MAVPAASITGRVTSYQCHANLLEMLVPVRLYLGDYGSFEWITIAGLWGGQFRYKAASEMGATFIALSKSIGMTPEELRLLYEQFRPVAGEELRRIEDRLVATAEALLRTVTELFHQRAASRRPHDRGIHEYVCE